MKTISAKQFPELFLSETPMIDVRAPIEFLKGAFPSALNLPILNDSERQKVGSCYKKKGQAAAVELGHELVSGDIKQARVEAWKTYIKKNPEAVLYCFRGGMRSQLSQQWLHQARCNISIVEGGYKALRNFLLGVIDEFSEADKLIVIGGRTGTGKTRVIHKLAASLDLEGLANHRGSAFGKQPTPQPLQINFENNLAIEMLKLKHHNYDLVAIEDESKLIGKNALPQSLKKAISQSNLVIVEQTLDQRIEVVIEEYVIDLIEQFKLEHPSLKFPQVFSIYQEAMFTSLKNIQKRIGDVRHKNLIDLMKHAMDSHLNHDDLSRHRDWIEPLLSEYYDKMYDYQLNQKKRRVVFTGNREQVISFLEEK